MAEPVKGWVEGVEGNFPIPKSVLDGKPIDVPDNQSFTDAKPSTVLPQGSTLVSAERSGVSAWTKTAKLTVKLVDGSLKRHFFKVAIPSDSYPSMCN